MKRYLSAIFLMTSLLSSPLFADEPRLCGGIGGVTCEGDLFCDHPVGTCGAGDLTGQCGERPEVCTKEYRPVVGCDGRVYSNACMAAASGISVKQPYTDPVEAEAPQAGTQAPAPLSGTAASRGIYQGKVRAQGTVERQVGRWSVQDIRNDGSTSTTVLRIRFPESVRDAVILASPYCTFSDHGPAAVGYGYLDDRTVDFVFEWPCGFLDFSGLDFMVLR